MRKTIVVVDTETTGLDANRHEIIEVYALLVSSRYRILAEAGGRTPLTNQAAASPGALEVNGYNWAEWTKTQRPLSEVLPNVIDLIDCADIWLGSNPRFDVDFIREACRKNCIDDFEPIELVDTAKLARQKGVTGRCGLDILCDRFGVSQVGAHSARADCYRALAVFMKLLTL